MMRAFVRTVQVLGLLVVAGLTAGAVVSADGSSFRASAYPTGPTATVTRTPTATNTPTATKTPKPTATTTPTPGGGGGPLVPQLDASILDTSSTKRLKVRVTISAPGKVKLRALRGKIKVGKKAVAFANAASKVASVRLKRSKLGSKRPVAITLVAKARGVDGARSNTVRVSRSLE